ncbi:ABC transporter ATP-binding protein [Phaeobacter italicus]|jgi:ABC-type branched-subunit amino acid transport system ATPase component|uniref:ABC transporter ATP-binding protein n=1 Tax=Phaeobacter italicus TaxID=481446 RepID=UPI002FD8AE99
MRLTAKNLSKSYTGHTVVDLPEVNFGVHGLEGLIGPNGAGKSTLMGLLTRRISPTSGEISLVSDTQETRLNPLESHDVARIGLIKTNQRIQGFDGLTVRDNLRLAATLPAREGFGSLFDRKRDAEALDVEVESYLDRFPFENRDGYARSGGEKKLLDILRCLIAKPKMLLMDEPTAGLPDDVTSNVMDFVQDLVRSSKMQVVIVEHDLPMIWKYCSYVHFLSEGKMLFQGSPDDVKSNHVVAEKYMGV